MQLNIHGCYLLTKTTIYTEDNIYIYTVHNFYLYFYFVYAKYWVVLADHIFDYPVSLYDHGDIYIYITVTTDTYAWSYGDTE